MAKEARVTMEARAASRDVAAVVLPRQRPRRRKSTRANAEG